MKLKLTDKERKYFAKKGAEGGRSGDPRKKATATKKRMAALTPEQRRELASTAGKASAAKRKAGKAKA